MRIRIEARGGLNEWHISMESPKGLLVLGLSDAGRADALTSSRRPAGRAAWPPRPRPPRPGPGSAPPRRPLQPVRQGSRKPGPRVVKAPTHTCRQTHTSSSSSVGRSVTHLAAPVPPRPQSRTSPSAAPGPGQCPSPCRSKGRRPPPCRRRHRHWPPRAEPRTRGWVAVTLPLLLTAAARA